MNKPMKMVPVFLMLLLIPAALYPFSFEPISMSLSPEGRGATGSFLLKNEGEEPVALRISLFERTMDREGAEARVPADHLFVVYPSRIVLAPHSVQSLRVKWNGGTDLVQERSFRILVEQLAVDFGGQASQGSGLQIMFRYLGAIYITPAGASPDTAVESFEKTGDDLLDLVLFNRGRAHFIITDGGFRFSETIGGQKTSITVPVTEFEGIEGENILAGSRRRFSVTPPPERKGEIVDVELVFP